jgi:hypothetical protein
MISAWQYHAAKDKHLRFLKSALDEPSARCTTYQTRQVLSSRSLMWVESIFEGQRKLPNPAVPYLG